MNKEMIQRLKEKLVFEKAYMEKQLAALSNDQQRGGQAISADWTEQATEKENDEVVDALTQLDSSKIDRIDLALKRIELGNYGTCMSCGNSIEENRLNAIAYATTCMDCS